MEQILTQDRVRLEENLPELGLIRGAVGTVVSTWFYPNTAYEVEFELDQQTAALRVLLLSDQLVGA